MGDTNGKRVEKVVCENTIIVSYAFDNGPLLGANLICAWVNEGILEINEI